MGGRNFGKNFIHGKSRERSYDVPSLEKGAKAKVQRDGKNDLERSIEFDVTLLPSRLTFSTTAPSTSRRILGECVIKINRNYETKLRFIDVTKDV